MRSIDPGASVGALVFPLNHRSNRWSNVWRNRTAINCLFQLYFDNCKPLVTAIVPPVTFITLPGAA